MHTAVSKELAINNNPLLEPYPKVFSKKELLRILVSKKAKLSNVSYTLLSIEENRELSRLLIVFIIVSDKLALLATVSSKMHLLVYYLI